MNGKRLLLDTNAIISLLQGNHSLIAQSAEAEWIGISIISQLEFLCFAKISAEDRRTFDQFLQKVNVVSLDVQNTALLEIVVDVRTRYRLKLPDAVIAAAAIFHQAQLVIADRSFAAISELKILPVN
ncbi:MAG TPA: PIN domain-containing protein [Tepidisphaeraceae bacterium]